jgi:hypothetical protein
MTRKRTFGIREEFKLSGIWNCRISDTDQLHRSPYLVHRHPHPAILLYIDRKTANLWYSKWWPALVLLTLSFLTGYCLSMVSIISSRWSSPKLMTESASFHSPSQANLNRQRIGKWKIALRSSAVLRGRRESDDPYVLDSRSANESH